MIVKMSRRATPEEVIAVADEVTASVHDDGAALVLRRLL